MAVPVEEAIAALSTFSLEVIPSTKNSFINVHRLCSVRTETKIVRNVLLKNSLSLICAYFNFLA